MELRLTLTNSEPNSQVSRKECIVTEGKSISFGCTDDGGADLLVHNGETCSGPSKLRLSGKCSYRSSIDMFADFRCTPLDFSGDWVAIAIFKGGCSTRGGSEPTEAAMQSKEVCRSDGILFSCEGGRKTAYKCDKRGTNKCGECDRSKPMDWPSNGFCDPRYVDYTELDCASDDDSRAQVLNMEWPITRGGGGGSHKEKTVTIAVVATLLVTLAVAALIGASVYWFYLRRQRHRQDSVQGVQHMPLADDEEQEFKSASG